MNNTRGFVEISFCILLASFPLLVSGGKVGKRLAALLPPDPHWCINGSPMIVYEAMNLKMVLWGLYTTLQVPPNQLSKIPTLFVLAQANVS